MPESQETLTLPLITSSSTPEPVPANKRSRDSAEVSRPPERIISRIQQFTEELGVAPERLSSESRKLFDELAGDSKEIGDEKRVRTFKQYIETLQRDSALTGETKNYLKNFAQILEKNLQRGTLSKENLLEGIKGIVKSPEIGLDDLQKKLVDNSLQEMQRIADDAKESDEKKESKIKEIFNKVPKPAKLLVLAILSIFGLSLVRALKSISSGEQMGRVA
jgi:hypothetical protein